MTPYSSDLRQRVLADCDDRMATPQGAAKYRVSAGRVGRLEQRRRGAGPIEPVARRHGPPPKWAPHAEAIAAAVRRDPDATPEERRAALGLGLGISTPWRAIDAPGPTPEESR
jgi:transposase